MKIAEILQALRMRYAISRDEFLPELIAAVQLDAYKQGMSDAAKIADESEACCSEGERIAKLIEAASEKKITV